MFGGSFDPPPKGLPLRGACSISAFHAKGKLRPKGATTGSQGPASLPSPLSLACPPPRPGGAGYMCVIKGSLKPREKLPNVVWGKRLSHVTATAEGAAGAPQLLGACAVGVSLGLGERQGGPAEPLGMGELGLGWGEEWEGRGPQEERGPTVRALLFLREMETETEGETGGAPPHAQGGAERRWEAGRGWRRRSREATRPLPQICVSSRGRGPPQVPPVQLGALARKWGLGSGLPVAGVQSSVSVPCWGTGPLQDPLSEGALRCPSLPIGTEY